MKWSDEQTAKLKELCFAEIPNAEIAKQLNVSLTDVHAKRSQLGITMPKIKAAKGDPAITINKSFEEAITTAEKKPYIKPTIEILKPASKLKEAIDLIRKLEICNKQDDSFCDQYIKGDDDCGECPYNVHGANSMDCEKVIIDAAINDELVELPTAKNIVTNERPLFFWILEQLLKLADKSIANVTETKANEIVTITYDNGYSRKVNIECDSYLGIITDVTNAMR